jgi:hypothetical protein
VELVETMGYFVDTNVVRIFQTRSVEKINRKKSDEDVTHMEEY